MAFFGLTSLGYQNTFAAASISSLNLHIFSLKEYETSWIKVLGTNSLSSKCSSIELQQIFRTLFHGPLPQYDAQILSEAFNGCSEEVTFQDYLEIIEHVRDWAEKESERKNNISSNCDVTTSSEFQESLRRHKRLPRSLQEKQQVPLTSTQEVKFSSLFLLFHFLLCFNFILFFYSLVGKDNNLNYLPMEDKDHKLHNLLLN